MVGTASSFILLDKDWCGDKILSDLSIALHLASGLISGLILDERFRDT